MFENCNPLICTKTFDVSGIDLWNWMWQIQMERERQITYGTSLWSWYAHGSLRLSLIWRARRVNIILILIINSSVWNISIQIFLRIHLRHSLSIFDRRFGCVTLFVTIFEEWWSTTEIWSNCSIGRDACVITGWAKRFLIVLLRVGNGLAGRVLIALLALLQPHVSKVLFVLYKSFLWWVNIIETSHGIICHRCWLLFNMSWSICQVVAFDMFLLRQMQLWLALYVS